MYEYAITFRINSAEAEIANNLGRRACEAGQADERAATTQA
jgi:hypothetical protein